MTTPATPALEVDGLGLQIGGARILQDVGFTVNAGEMIGVIGPNGAGKTTLFNLISGVLRPTAGSIALNGRPITNEPIHRRARAAHGSRQALTGSSARNRWTSSASAAADG